MSGTHLEGAAISASLTFVGRGERANERYLKVSAIFISLYRRCDVGRVVVLWGKRHQSLVKSTVARQNWRLLSVFVHNAAVSELKLTNNLRR